jgi:hypothetical protein
MSLAGGLHIRAGFRKADIYFIGLISIKGSMKRGVSSPYISEVGLRPALKQIHQ